MPITVRHDPPAGVIEQAAYQGGLGDRNRFAAQLALQYDQMAQQAANQARAIAAAQQNQAAQRVANERQAVFDAQNRMAQLGMGRQWQMDDAERNRGWAVEDRDFGAQADIDRIEAGAAAAQEGRQWNWEVGQVESLDSQFGKIDAAITKTELNQQGQKEYANWLGKRQAVERQRASLRPAQYAELQSKLLNEFHGLGLQNKVIEKPTIDTEWGGRVKDFGNGMGAVLQPDGKIDVLKFAPDQKPVAPKVPSWPEFAANRKDFDAAYKDAYSDLYDQKEKAAGVEGTFTPPTREEVVKEMQDRHNLWMQQAGPAVAPVAENDTVSPEALPGIGGQPQGGAFAAGQLPLPPPAQTAPPAQQAAPPPMAGLTPQMVHEFNSAVASATQTRSPQAAQAAIALRSQIGAGLAALDVETLRSMADGLSRSSGQTPFAGMVSNEIALRGPQLRNEAEFAKAKLRPGTVFTGPSGGADDLFVVTEDGGYERYAPVEEQSPPPAIVPAAVAQQNPRIAALAQAVRDMPHYGHRTGTPPQTYAGAKRSANILPPSKKHGTISPVVAEWAQANLPRVQTRAEFEALPSGENIPYIAPDGSIRKKP